MKRIGKLCICLAGGLALNAGARAADSPPPDGPYAPIVVRNVFDIHPLPPVDPNQAPASPPPKITPNGITSVYGRVQALFKVAIPPTRNQPPKDQSYMLGEGQQQDDIEVTKIDEKAGVVTFNNHGTVQELPLAVAVANGPSGVVPGLPPGAPGASYPVPKFMPGGGNANNGNNGYIRFGSRFGQPGNAGGENPGIGGATPSYGANPTFNGGNNANNGVNLGSKLGVVMGGASGSSGSPSGSQSGFSLTPEQRAAMAAAIAASTQDITPPPINRP